ncbi:hypothetical protein OS493_010404 [Desmophyllum pertusum]|uniref:Uncharacterized protein n=1 Tax=Desmophyllum pertusum TaxID=174260 RepID=A0A9X0A4Q2_9CNID|nr:hypothetical protein OS493_010404 [Desmophyllum pertusum]
MGKNGVASLPSLLCLSANKWDEVEKQTNQAERDDVQKHIIDKLRKKIPELDEKSQLIKIWITGQLCNLSDQVKGEMRNAKRNGEERRKAREELEVKLDKLKQGTPIREIDDAISNHVKHLCGKMTSYLQSEDVRKLGKQRKAFKTAYDDLDERFHRGFFDFEKDIRAIDRVLIGDSGDEFKSFEIRPGRLFSPLDTRMKKFLVVTGAIFMPVLFSVGLAAGFLSAPVFGFKVIEKHLKERKLINDSCQALTELAKEFLEAFISNEVLNHVRDKFSEETNRIASIKRCHQQLITKYEQRCKDLTRSEDESRDKEIVEKNFPLHAKLQEMNETLMFDAIKNGIQVMYPSCQIDARRLRCNERELLGGGSYGQVFKGKFTPPRHATRDVAVKKPLEAPHSSNVAAFLQEAAMLK